jgi:enamine deaminase RidA (YjgF/YER057c/UK114 family)
VFIGGVVDADQDGVIRHPGDVVGQARAVFLAIQAILESQGGSADDLVNIVSFHADTRQIEAVLDVGREFLSGNYPAWTQAGFGGTTVPGALVMVRAVAHLGALPKQSIVPETQRWLRNFPMAAGCRKGDLIFVAGQSGADREGRVPTPVDHCAQARSAYRNMREVLELGGATFADVLDFTSFHLDVRGAIPTLEDVYRPEVIGDISMDHAATTSHVGCTGLLRTEMLGVYTCLADVSGGGRIGSTPEMITWNQGNGSYPIAGASKKREGKVITVSGQVSSGINHTILHPGDVEAQARFIFDEIAASIGGFGAAMSDVVEVCSFHKDPRSWDVIKRVASEFFPSGAEPAWTFVGSPGLWLEGYMHEISAIAVLDD